jgi:hypothetical protein
VKRPSLRDEIVRLSMQEHLTGTEIAQKLGCSTANVTRTLQRALIWDGRVTPLPGSVTLWLSNEAAVQDKSVRTVARDIIINAFNQRKKP